MNKEIFESKAKLETQLLEMIETFVTKNQINMSVNVKVETKSVLRDGMVVKTSIIEKDITTRIY